MKSFHDVDLPVAARKALQAMEFQTPTLIQARVIPPAFEGRDLIACAQTGSGKTVAYCLPILTGMLTGRLKNALVLVPTRELAQQIDTVWRDLTQFAPGFQSAVIIGGMSMKAQTKALSRRARLVIATPGRLVDHLNRRTAQLSETSVLVLDEADRMLDMGFLPQLQQVMRHVPKQRQTLLLSATWADELDRLSRTYLQNPERITVGAISRAAPEVSQALVSTTQQKKNDLLVDELNRRPGSILIFTRTKSRTDRVARYLATFNVSVNRIHGGRSQGQRNQALDSFRAGKVRVLVATDIAARGLDISDIAHVVNYDLPMSPEDYIHRIGRTGRAGAKGQAVSFVTPEERGQWRDIVRLLQKTGSQVPSLAKDSALGSQKGERDRPQAEFTCSRKPYSGLSPAR